MVSYQVMLEGRSRRMVIAVEVLLVLWRASVHRLAVGRVVVDGLRICRLYSVS